MIYPGDNVHAGLEKIAGGGARAFKSFRRALEKRLRVTLKEKTPNWGDLTKAQQSRALDKAVVRQMNASPHIVTERRALQHLPFGRRKVKGHDSTYFTHGEQTWSGVRRDPSKKIRHGIRKVDVIPMEDISKMRGKFVTDQIASASPIGGMDKMDAIFFRGKLPRNLKKYERTAARTKRILDESAARAHRRGKPHQALHKNTPEVAEEYGTSLRYDNPLPDMTPGQARVQGASIRRNAAYQKTKPEIFRAHQIMDLSKKVGDALSKIKPKPPKFLPFKKTAGGRPKFWGFVPQQGKRVIKKVKKGLPKGPRQPFRTLNNPKPAKTPVVKFLKSYGYRV
jgi:hypothetical protein